MRLVDADELKKSGYRLVHIDNLNPKIERRSWVTVPTVSEAEVIAEQLENYRAEFDCKVCKYGKTEPQVCTKDCTDALVDGLLEIVRKGGVE